MLEFLGFPNPDAQRCRSLAELWPKRMVLRLGMALVGSHVALDPKYYSTPGSG